MENSFFENAISFPFVLLYILLPEYKQSMIFLFCIVHTLYHIINNMFLLHRMTSDFSKAIVFLSILAVLVFFCPFFVMTMCFWSLQKA